MKFSLSLLLAVLALLFFGSAAAWDDLEDTPTTYYFFRSQIRSDQDWCFGAPDRWPDSEPEYQDLEFGLCEQYFDEYALGGQAWRLDSEGKLLNAHWDYDYACVMVGGGGKLRFYKRCREEDDTAKFLYDSTTNQLKFNETHCVTNSGTTPEVGDPIMVLPCTSALRFKFDLVEGRRYWQILEGQASHCVQPVRPVHPRSGDKVEVNDCYWGLDAWRYERVEDDHGDKKSDAVLIHIRQRDSLCMQAGGVGSSGPLQAGTEILLYPCNKENHHQRFVQVYGTGDYDYQYSLKVESYDDLCVSYHGGTSFAGDPLVLKDCSDEEGFGTWLDDEG